MQERSIVFVGGEFNDAGGRPSVYAQQLAQELQKQLPGDWQIHNGGSTQDLQRIHDGAAKTASILIWIPQAEKPIYKTLTADLKANNQKTMLVTAKDTTERNYDRKLLVAKALDEKANLLLETKVTPSGGILTSIIDPLNNLFADQEQDVAALAHRLATRLEQLISVKRTGSRKIGSEIPCAVDDDVKSFLDVVRKHSLTFHELIHIPHQGRSLGNISFRCVRGFPAARSADPQLIYISKRNVDKRFIGPDDLVAVRLDSDDPVQYYADGDKKPSVDGPIQIGLFNEFPKVNYILHSHTYIEGAPFTENIYPCGAAEELEEIKRTFSDKSTGTIMVNLRGHGSLAMVSDWRELEKIPYVARDEHDKANPWQPPEQSRFADKVSPPKTGWAVG